MKYSNDSLISHRSKKQASKAISTAEVEIIAISEVVKGLKVLISVLEEMEIPVEWPVQIFNEKQVTITIFTSDKMYRRAKHI